MASLTDLTGQLQFLGRPFLFFDAIENRLVFSGFLPNDSFGGPNGFNLLALSLSDLSIETIVEASAGISFNGATALFDEQGDLSSVVSLSNREGILLDVVDVSTGLVSNAGSIDGLGPELMGLTGLTAGPPGQLYAVSSLGFIFQIDMQTGARVIISR